MVTLTQKRARDAYEKVHEVAGGNRDEKFRNKYGSLARGLPFMIQTNGLSSALAFLRAKAKGDPQAAPMVLYTHLSGWLGTQMLVNTANNPDFLVWLVNQNIATYFRATVEALEFSVWLKRFAEAEGLGGEETGGGED